MKDQDASGLKAMTDTTKPVVAEIWYRWRGPKGGWLFDHKEPPRHWSYERVEVRSALSEAPAPEKRAELARWNIDHSAGRPILTLDGCSVIEAEDADYLMRLIELDQVCTALATTEDATHD